MDGDSRVRRWTVVALAVVAAIAIGATAYQAGVMHGVSLQPPAATASANGAAQPAAPAPYPYYPYRYYGPWRFGFFGFFGPLLTIVLMLSLARMLFWGFSGWGWRRRYWHYDPELRSRRFEEWHRRAHERMREGSAGTEA